MYKRQGLGEAMKGVPFKSERELKMGLSNIEKFLMAQAIESSVRAVSYTHLDVYKRQEYLWAFALITFTFVLRSAPLVLKYHFPFLTAGFLSEAGSVLPAPESCLLYTSLQCLDSHRSVSKAEVPGQSLRG